MAHSAHIITSGANKAPVITVRDDHGETVTELDPPDEVTDPVQLDSQLHAAGWTRNGEWALADDGWTAPVAPA